MEIEGVKGLEGLTVKQVETLVEKGAKFVQYYYCVSYLIGSSKTPSKIYFIRPHEDAVSKSWGFTIISFLFGWWGFPHGFIWTPQCIAINMKGGKNVTRETLREIID
jgi:hypothetical protein